MRRWLGVVCVLSACGGADPDTGSAPASDDALSWPTRCNAESSGLCYEWGGEQTASHDQLQALLGVDRRTVQRWRRWWRESLRRSPWWRVARARFIPPLEARQLPGALLERFEAADPVRRILDVLAFLAPLSVGAEPVH